MFKENLAALLYVIRKPLFPTQMSLKIEFPIKIENRPYCKHHFLEQAVRESKNGPFQGIA